MVQNSNTFLVSIAEIISVAIIVPMCLGVFLGWRPGSQNWSVSHRMRTRCFLSNWIPQPGTDRISRRPSLAEFRVKSEIESSTLAKTACFKIFGAKHVVSVAYIFTFYIPDKPLCKYLKIYTHTRIHTHNYCTYIYITCL